MLVYVNICVCQYKWVAKGFSIHVKNSFTMTVELIGQRQRGAFDLVLYCFVTIFRLAIPIELEMYIDLYNTLCSKAPYWKKYIAQFIIRVALLDYNF